MSCTNMNFWMLFSVYWLLFLLDVYLHYRQYKIHLKCAKRPDNVAEIISAEDYGKIRRFKLDMHRFNFAEKIFQGFGTLAILLFKPSDYLSEFSGKLSKELIADRGIIWQGSYHLAVFFAIYFAVHLVLHVPFSYYKTFMIDRKYGFKKETVTQFVVGEVLSLAFCIAAFSVAPVGLTWLMGVVGEQRFLNGWLSLCIGLFGLVAMYPNVHIPPFEAHIPLSDGRLRKKIVDVCNRVNFPLQEIFVVKAGINKPEYVITSEWWNLRKDILLSEDLLSEELLQKFKGNKSPDQSSKSPAAEAENQKGDNVSLHTCEDDGDAASRRSSVPYACDLDTTQSDSEEDSADKTSVVSVASCSKKNTGWTDGEILAMVGLELGRWKLWHKFIDFSVKQIKALFWLLALTSLFYPKASFDGSSRLNSFLSSQIFFTALQMVSCHLSRRMVFQADRFASEELGCSLHLRSALLKVAKSESCVLPVDDRFFACFNLKKPATVERIEALKKYD